MYYVFAGKFFYPSGGAGDLYGMARTLEGAKEMAKQASMHERNEWVDIMDGATGGSVDTGLDVPNESGF